MPQVLGINYTPYGPGDYRALMNQIRSKGLVPANMAWIMEASVDAIQSGNQAARNDIVVHYKDTSDGLGIPRQNSYFSGRFKFVPASEFLTKIKPDAELIDFAIPLGTDENYANLPGVEFRRINLDGREYAVLTSKSRNGEYKHTEELYEAGATPIGRKLGIVNIDGKEIDEVNNSDLWLAFAGYDFTRSPDALTNQKARNLLEEFYTVIATERKREYHDNDAMRVYVPAERKDQSHLRPWVVVVSTSGLMPMATTASTTLPACSG